MRIKNYIEYITEMERFKSNSSRTGSTKEYDVVFDEPSSAKSPSAGIMLKNLLKKKEFEEELGRSFTLSDLTNATKEEKKSTIHLFAHRRDFEKYLLILLISK